MILYEEGTTNFTRNGLGYLNDVLTAKVTEELNGEYSLDFEYPTLSTMANELKEGRIVKCKVSNGTMQCFIIKKVTKTYDKMTINCSHLFYLLLDDFAENIYPYQLSPKPFLDWVLQRANYQLPFNVTSDVSVQKTARYVRKNLVEVIIGEQKNSMVNLFGIEINRNNFNIALNSRIGADRGEKLLYGKNITGINITTDATQIYTRIMPIGFDGLLLPEKYIDADNINDYPYPKIALIEFSDIKYDPEDESAYHDIEDAYDALREQVAILYENGVNLPKINIKIDWLELSKTEEYKQYSNLERVELGDTIHAEIFGLNYTTRVIKTVYNPLTDRVEKFEIGTLQANYATQMNKYEFELNSINPASILEEAQNNATSLITSAMGGYVYKTNNELYIMDSDDPATAVHVWRWNINGLGYSSTGINGPYGLAMTMDGSIVADYITTGTLRTSVIEGYDSLTLQVTNNTGQISTLTQNVGELNSKIQDIADITTAEESEYATVNLLNVNESQPIMIKIHPMSTQNISYLYPRNNLYPSDTLYMPVRTLRFANTTTNEIFDYELFDDLLYYDSEHYDEFYWDYDSEIIQITKRCEYAADGSVVLKQQEVIETRPFPSPEEFYLTTGDYTVSLLGYSSAYIMVRCMASNIYTSQFSTRSELSQTASQIRTEVSGSYATKNELQVVDSRITQTATDITTEVSNTYATKQALQATNSTIQQTADSITSQVAQTYETKNDAEENYSSLNSTITQKANEIYSSVAETYATQNTTNTLSSRISQTAKSIALSINNGGTTSGITITTTKEDGTTATATGTIEMTGLVKFTDLSTSGSTTINGANITTGTISTNRLSSNVITTSNFSAQNINASKITSGTLNGNNVSITNLKAGNIVSGTLNGNNVSITNIKAGNITTGTLNGIPLTSCSYSFKKGSQEIRISTTSSYGIFTNWVSNVIRSVIDSGTFYSYTSSGSLGAYLNSSGVHTSSDIRYKKHIKNIEQQKSINIITNLTPIEYDYDTEEKHRGLSAQEVEEILNKNDYKNQVYDIDKDGKYSLNYIELIPDLINCIKYQQEEINNLKKEIQEIKEMIKNG